MNRVSLFLISLFFFLPLVADNIQMPPSMPGMSVKKGTSKKVESNDSCKVIPTMLVHLPPMLETDLEKCKNSLHMPSISVAEKRLQDILKKNVKVHKVSIVKGFSMLYKIESNVGDFYCNRYVDRCLAPSMSVVE